MKVDNAIKTDHEIFENPLLNRGEVRKVNVLYLNKKQISAYFDTRIYLKSSLFILVLNGSVHVEVNFKEFLVKKNTIALLAFGHFFMLKEVSKDFKCLLLYIGKDYIDECIQAI